MVSRGFVFFERVRVLLSRFTTTQLCSQKIVRRRTNCSTHYTHLNSNSRQRVRGENRKGKKKEGKLSEWEAEQTSGWKEVK